MPESADRHVKTAFAFRMGYLAAAWGAAVVAAPRVADGTFGAVLMALAWGLPVVAPGVAWLDWRWLKAHPAQVTRFGFLRRE